MPENITNCPRCDNNCPLDNPGCGKGERYARELRGEAVPEAGEHAHEHGEHGEHERREHGKHERHEHGHGHHHGGHHRGRDERETNI